MVSRAKSVMNIQNTSFDVVKMQASMAVVIRYSWRLKVLNYYKCICRAVSNIYFFCMWYDSKFWNWYLWISKTCIIFRIILYKDKTSSKAPKWKVEFQNNSKNRRESVNMGNYMKQRYSQLMTPRMSNIMNGRNSQRNSLSIGNPTKYKKSKIEIVFWMCKNTIKIKAFKSTHTNIPVLISMSCLLVFIIFFVYSTYNKLKWYPGFIDMTSVTG